MAETQSKQNGAILRSINDNTGVYLFIGDDQRPWRGTFLNGSQPTVNTCGSIGDAPNNRFWFAWDDQWHHPFNATFTRA